MDGLSIIPWLAKCNVFKNTAFSPAPRQYRDHTGEWDPTILPLRIWNSGGETLQRISWKLKRGTVNSTSWEWGLKEEVFSLVPLHTPSEVLPATLLLPACRWAITKNDRTHKKRIWILDATPSQWTNQACLTCLWSPYRICLCGQCWYPATPAGMLGYTATTTVWPQAIPCLGECPRGQLCH